MSEETATQVAEKQESVQKEPTYQEWKAEREGKKPSVAEVQAESSAESEAAQPEKKVEDKKDSQPKGKGGFQDRINQLTREKREREEKIRLLEEQLKRKDSPEGGKKEAASDAKPKLEDFKTHEEFVEAIADWKIEQRAKKAEQEKAQSKHNEELQKTFDAYNKKVSEAKDKYPDYEEKVGELNLPRVAQLAIMEEDNSTDIAYYLAENPDIADSLNGLSDVKTVAKIGRIAERLEKESEKSTTENSEDKKPETKVPPPIKPVGGSSARSTVDLDKLPYQDYKKARERQERR